MSRIREALKKAAEERSLQSVERTTEDFIEVLEKKPPRQTVIVSEPPQAKMDAAPRTEVGGTDFDNLIGRCRKVKWYFDPRYSVFTNAGRDHGGAERFRTLRSRLLQIAAGRPLRRVLLTSSVPQEGKTFVASNLAQSFIPQEDRQVLLIDADLRASRLHLTLGTQNEPGLSDYLSGDADLTHVMQVGADQNLCFIPGGRTISKPSELLHSEKMKLLLEKMSERFDWIILDSPPAIAVHDASILADMCDGVLFVVRAGSTDFEIAQKAVGEFQGKNLLGVVLNRVDKRESYGDYYYYGYPHPKLGD